MCRDATNAPAGDQDFKCQTSFFLTEKYTVDIYESSNNIEIILTSINKQEAELNLDQVLYQFVMILKFVLK